MKYTRRYFINSSIASPLILDQAHVIFAAIKLATFRSLNLRRKGKLGFGSNAIPMAGYTPNPSSSNTPYSGHFRLKVSHYCNYELDF
jgi:hypothetical protein